MSDKELWVRALSIIHDVQQDIGDDLSYEFRSTQTYQAYTGVCGEIYHAIQDGELDDEMVSLLEEYAQKVIALKHNKRA